MKEAMEKSDYSESYANASTRIKGTEGYKEAITPVLDSYIAEEKRLLEAMNKKDLNKEQYRVLTDAVDKIRKQIQLLSGGATERSNLIIELSGVIAEKRKINDITSSTK